MARNNQHPSITQKNDASCIPSRRGMSRRAKTNSNKRDRQILSKDMEARMEDLQKNVIHDALGRLAEEQRQVRENLDKEENKDTFDDTFVCHYSSDPKHKLDCGDTWVSGGYMPKADTWPVHKANVDQTKKQCEEWPTGNNPYVPQQSKCCHHEKAMTDSLAEIKAFSERLKKQKDSFDKELDVGFQEHMDALAVQMDDEELKSWQDNPAFCKGCVDLLKAMRKLRRDHGQEMEKGWQDAYEIVLKERKKNDDLEVVMYEEYDKKLNEAKEWLIDKIDLMLKLKLEEYRGDLEEMCKNVNGRKVMDEIEQGVVSERDMTHDQLMGELRKVQARCIRLEAENSKLTEHVRGMNKVIDSKPLLPWQNRKVTGK